MIVTTLVDEEAEEVRVNVTDFGIGIPDFKQDAVFKKFYRVEESSLQFQEWESGYLSVPRSSNSTMEVLGVSSIVDEGSTFISPLPLN